MQKQNKTIKSNNIINKDRLWVVTELYYPEVTSTGYYLTKIAEGLADDFNVGVICGQPNYSARGITAPKVENHKGVEIKRVSGTRLNKNVIPFRIINMISLSITIFISCLIRFKKNDRVLVVTTPPLLPFVTGFASMIKRSRHILLIHDNYPEILIAADKVKENSILTKLLNNCNSLLYKQAYKIIVVGRDMKKLISAKMKNIDTEKIYIIPNWAELETVSPANRDENPLLEELQIKDKLVFLYAGNMGYPNDLESFIKISEKLKTDKRFHFVFLGAGVKKSFLIKQVDKKQLTNITILDPKPRSEQQIFLNACDVAIVSLVKKMLGVSMPSRTYNILAVGKPVLAICEKDSEIDLVIKDDNLGWSVKPKDSDGLLKVIYEIYAQKDKLNEMGNRARKAAVEKYSVDTAIYKYKQVINNGASDNVISL